jgi:hypothetical protein
LTPLKTASQRESLADEPVLEFSEEPDFSNCIRSKKLSETVPTRNLDNKAAIVTKSMNFTESFNNLIG